MKATKTDAVPVFSGAPQPAESEEPVDTEPKISLPNSAGAVVETEVDHFTLFGLFQEYSISRVLSFGEVYAFPNPARPGQHPTLHIEAGNAKRVEIRIHDISGELVHTAEVQGPAQIIDDGQGPEQAFEYRWDVSGMGSGVYLYVAIAHHPDGGKITKVGKCSVIK